MGKRKLYNTLINPTSNSEDLQKQYAITQYVHDNYEIFEDIRNELRNIGDFERLYRKLILQRVAPAELSQFHTSLNIILNTNRKVYIPVKMSYELSFYDHRDIKLSLIQPFGG